jgi:uncharacterized repeat protein (TIGR01451 family)
MKSRSVVILALILSLSVIPSLQLALGAASSSSSSSSSTTTTSTSSAAPSAPFSQRLDLYLAGSNDYWQVTLSPVNATRPSIVAAESVSGVTAYQVTAIEGSTSLVGSQLFFSQGYNVAKVPFLPYSGIFLNLTASSQSAAAAAASDFDSLFGANFVLTGSAGGNYSYFAQAGFTIAGSALFSVVPVHDKGLATIANESAWMGDPTPIGTLTGVRSGSAFTHTFSFGATEQNAVGSNGTLNLENALNLLNTTFITSPNATSTTVVVHALDGLIQSGDNATVRDHVGNFSSSYAVTLPNGRAFRPNLTIMAYPPVVTASRSVDKGALSSGGLVTVTLNIVNSAENGTVRNVVVNDNWWTSYPSLFSLSAGNSSFTIPSLGPDQNVSRAYSLKVTSSASQDITVPAAKVSYSYVTGKLTVNETTNTNQLELRTNNPGPAIQIKAESNILSGSSLGKPGQYQVTVVNTGNDPAVSLQILNYTNPTLAPGGGWKINMSLPLTSISIRNLTQTFTVGWTAPDGSTGTLVSNPARVVLSHSSISLPVVQFKLVATLNSKLVAEHTVNATYVLVNRGTANANSVVVNQTFPAGLTCTAVVKGNGTCGPTGFSMHLTSAQAFENFTGTLRLNFTNDNYVAPGASITTTQSGGLVLNTLGSPLALAAGVTANKSFNPDKLFVGQQSNATLSVSNTGSLTLYNVSISTSADPFDSAVSGSLHQVYPTLAPTSSKSLNYTVKMTESGNHTSGSTLLTFVFGGSSQQYSVVAGSVLVYKAPIASSSTPSTPTEGSDFSLSVSVQNPSPANVSNVVVSIPLPTGLTIVNYSSGFKVVGHTITLTVPSLAAGESTSHSVTLRSALDGTFTLGAGTLTFDYLGSTINGVVQGSTIAVGVGSLLRFELSIALAVIIVLAVAIYMHRKLVVPAK